MFEKFTEKAINAVTDAQNQAKLMKSIMVQPEHLLLSLVVQSKGVPLKLLRMSGINYEDVKAKVENKLRFEKTDKTVTNVPFSDNFKDILKNTLDLASKSGNSYILFEHLFIAVLNDKKSYSSRILEDFGFNIDNARDILLRIVQKKLKKAEHPEIEEVQESKETVYNNLDTSYLFENERALKIHEIVKEKVSQSGYEMIGTEQILSAILSYPETDIYETMQNLGITSEKFDEILSEIKTREAEYLDQKLIITPVTYKLFEVSSQMAKEMGSPVIRSEHVILSILQLKKGLAYEVLKKMGIDEDKLTEEIMKPIEHQMPQALTILKLAKQEARRLGRNFVGTEMILLGVIAEGTGIGFKVLNDLEINLKDVREIIEKTIGYGNEYYDSEISFTRRAKRILEVAWQKAKKYKRSRIMSEHLLYAITTEPSSVAMMALEQLGVDAVEIRQGIMKEIEA